ncbi:aspartyl protease family protein At5g10770-like [Dendrobium catenatum]|nr:aspartyl protease family protein At5g10770-like [Dendrobium catenatum]
MLLIEKNSLVSVRWLTGEYHLNPLGSSVSATVPIEEGVFFGTHKFIVTIYLGSPPSPYSLVFDTGSDVTWMQCIPCEKCYPQKDPIYNPFESSTYASIRCHSDYCSQLNTYDCSWTDNCLYEVQYRDGSYTKGYLVQDTLQFSYDIIKNFRYGCGQNNSFSVPKVDGILGFGRGPLSIISQTAQSYDLVFSYCLPSKPGIIGYLSLGSDVGIDAIHVQYTPMITNEMMPSFYFVKLISITVGGDLSAHSPTVFKSPRTMLASGKKAMLDSGTVISRLPPITYYGIRNTFRKYMANYPRAPSWGILDTCYNFTNYQDVNVKVPRITFEFDGGVIIKLDISGILLGTTKSKQCLAFAANKYASDKVIIGNVQLRTFNIVHDIKNLRIGFGADGCS